MNEKLLVCKTQYTPDFQAAWDAFPTQKNASKSDAFKAWQQSQRTRMSAGMFGKRAVEVSKLYARWLEGENIKRHRQRQSDHAVLHYATFLRQTRWESFMDEAEQNVARAELADATASGGFTGWESEARSLIAELGAPKVESYLANVTVRRGESLEVMFPSAFKASYVAVNLRPAMLRAFGHCVLTVEGKASDRYEI